MITEHGCTCMMYTVFWPPLLSTWGHVESFPGRNTSQIADDSMKGVGNWVLCY